MNPWVERVSYRPLGIEIDFSRLPAITIQAHEIIRCRLTGEIRARHDFNRTNIVQSTLISVDCYEADFKASDFKDSSFSESDFEKTNFRGAHLNTSSITNCQFQACEFTNSNFNRSEFQGCTFTEVNFTDLLIKACTFKDCTFIDCVTSNKLFESCLLLDCCFRGTQIQLQTIIDNFGISENQLTPVEVRSSSPREGFELLSRASLENILKTDMDLDTLARFRLSFFLGRMNGNSYSYLDESFDVRGWIKMCRTPGTFSAVAESLSSFLLYLYDSESLTSHALLKFHSVTAFLSEQIDSETSPGSKEVYRTLMGIHMSLARRVESFLVALVGMVAIYDGRVSLLVEGTGELEFYRERLKLLAEKAAVEFVAIKPRNSPLELILGVLSTQNLLTLVAIVLASRTEFEIQKLTQSEGFKKPLQSLPPKREQKREPEDDDELHQSVEQGATQLLSLKAGRGKEAGDLLELKLRAIVPGSLLIRLGLDVSLKKIYSMRDVILDFIVHSRQAPGDKAPSDVESKEKESNSGAQTPSRRDGGTSC